MKKTLFISAILCLLNTAIPLLLFAEEIQIKHADILEADKEQIIIKGNIIINFKDAVIEAPEGQITTNEKGEQETARFTGRSKIKLKDRYIEADKITVKINEKTIYAEGRTISELRDKNNEPIKIECDYQELSWEGENANAKGNLRTKYQETNIKADSVKIIYKNKKPDEAIFTSSKNLGKLEQPSNITTANEFVFNIPTHNVLAHGDVMSTVWPNTNVEREKQEPIFLTSDNLYIDNATGKVTAKSDKTKVKLSYTDTNGESLEAYLIRGKNNGNPEKIVFKGSADVKQQDKELISEEVVFSFNDKKLTSTSSTNIRPKTIIYKKSN